MITEQELFEIGFRRYGDEENDPYYKAVLKGDVFGIHFLSGNLVTEYLKYTQCTTVNFRMKALIKKKGEVKEVKSMWHIQTVSFDFKFDTDYVDIDTEKYTNKVFYHEGSKDYNTDYIELSDGKTYKKSELIIGADNIRDYKIKNITD